MKAIVYTKFGPPDVLQLQEMEKPAPKEHEVLIKIHAASVAKEDPDLRAASGFNGFFKPRNPILGQEFAGEIEDIGKAVTRFRPGDQVFGIDMFGAHAEYKCISENGALARKPINMSYEEAAGVPNGALTALPFLRDKGSIQCEQDVLIYGASGSVGTAAVQLARYFGAHVTGVCSTVNLEWVKELGAEEVIDYTREDFTENGKMYDIIYDTPGKRTFSECRSSLTPDGIYLTTVPSPAVLFQAVLATRRGRRVRFLAAGLRSAPMKVKDLIFLTELIEDGKFKTVIDRCYPLEQTAEAHRYVEKGHKKGNVIITMTT